MFHNNPDAANNTRQRGWGEWMSRRKEDREKVRTEAESSEAWGGESSHNILTLSFRHTLSLPLLARDKGTRGDEVRRQQPDMLLTRHSWKPILKTRSIRVSKPIDYSRVVWQAPHAPHQTQSRSRYINTRNNAINSNKKWKRTTLQHEHTHTCIFSIIY